MRVLAKNVFGFLAVLALSFVFLSTSVRADTTVVSGEQGFTAVAGTEVAVQDKRKNNTTLVSGFVLAFIALALVGAVAHSRRKIS